MSKLRLEAVRRTFAITTIMVFCGCSTAQSTTSDASAGAASESLTLYSIDGNDRVKPDNPQDTDDTKSREVFHEFPVLGKLEITDHDQRIQIMKSLQSAMDRSDGTMAKCFWPRHGIRVVDKVQTVDYVICFECMQLEIHRDGKETRKAVVRDPQDEWNQILAKAGVKLPPAADDGAE